MVPDSELTMQALNTAERLCLILTGLSHMFYLVRCYNI